MSWTSIRVALPLILLASCVTPTVPPPAVTELEAGSCQSDYVLSGAIPVGFEENSSRKQVIVDAEVGEQSNCIKLENGLRSAYAVFKLPAWHADYTVVAGSVYEANRIMPPIIVILGHDGRRIREYSKDRLLEREGHLSISFHQKPDDVYVVVRSNPNLVGDDLSRIKTGVSSTYVSFGYGGAYIPTSADASSNVTYSHYGNARVRLYRTSTEE